MINNVFIPLILSLAVSELTTAATSNEPPPNFVVILVDDMGWTGLSGYGSDLHQTPNIDRLASKVLIRRFGNRCT